MNNLVNGIIVLVLIAALTLSIIAIVQPCKSPFEDGNTCPTGPKQLDKYKPTCKLFDSGGNELIQFKGTIVNGKCKFSTNQSCDCPDKNNFYQSGPANVTKDIGKNTCTLNNINIYQGNKGNHSDTFSSSNPCSYYNYLYTTSEWTDNLKKSDTFKCQCSKNNHPDFNTVWYYKYNEHDNTCEPILDKEGAGYADCYT
jgi:hypothetical protein